MLVYCNGFWGGFKDGSDGINFTFFKHILEQVFQTEITVSESFENSDILLETHFSTSLLTAKSWKYTLFYSGEGLHGLPPNYEKYSIVLGSIDSGKNFIPCPLFFVYEYCKPFIYNTNCTEYPEKDILAVVSANHENSYRNKLIEELQMRGYSIDFGGSYKNNIGYKVGGQWYTTELLDLQKKYKLVLALENSKHNHYITEKVVNPLRAQTIPIYYGSDFIDTFINKERIVTIYENDSEKTFSEINRLLVDKEYWLQKVSSSIFLTPLEINIEKIVNKMKQIISEKKFNVEIICNINTESERLESLKDIIRHFQVYPSYTIWGDNTKKHKYFYKFKSTTTLPAISLAINTISCFEQYINSDKPLLICESDCVPLYDVQVIENKINNIIDIIKENDIDFVFLNKGHLNNLDINIFKINYTDPRIVIDVDLKNTKCYETILYETNVSRCTEAFLVTPKGIKSYLDYFYSTDNHVPIDWDLNYFFYANKNIKSCWLIPELFKQYGYQSTIPHSIL